MTATLTLPPARTHVPLVFLIWFAGLGAAAQFGKVAIAIDGVAARYPVSPAQIGFLVSAVGLCGLIFGIAAGVIVGRIGFRRAIVYGLASGGVLSFVEASLPGYPLMIALRLIEGASHILIVVAGPVLISSHSSGRARSAAMALWGTFFAVSYALLALLAPPVLALGGLPALLIAHGGIMLALAGTLFVALPADEPSVPLPNRSRSSLSDWIAVHRRIYASPVVAAPGLGFVWYTAAYVALLTYLPGFVAEPLRPGFSASMPLASLCLSLTLGVLALRYFNPVPVAQAGFLLMGLMVLPLALTLGQDGIFTLLAIAMMCVSGFSSSASFALLGALSDSLTDRANAAGALAQMGNVGSTLGPPILAFLIAQSGFSGVVGYVLVLCAGGIAVHAWLARRRKLST
ncbi:MFS transporter [Poseidonocella sedimentorum]|uniref:Predicted arabinose efflux permease, MFS family n=1 Tax=Poseidonocella sedimentorum TaxID=871652 RepID=A0A1I6EI41_9RHOB|nr:MFS transporter [Poseidonocella sedimentorum]SFR17423.1 Predicted arabinose efflux permease, MFS family [Poseidonocella sedimentorum]